MEHHGGACRLVRRGFAGQAWLHDDLSRSVRALSNLDAPATGPIREPAQCDARDLGPPSMCPPSMCPPSI